MSGNDEQIDLNSDVDLGGREFEAQGINLSHPVTDSVNEQSNAESCSRELGEDKVDDIQETNSSREGLCRSDKDEAGGNVGCEAADVETLEGRSVDNAKGTEVDAATRMGEESSMAINALSESEVESSERRHISEKVEVVCGDEIIPHDNEVVNTDGTLNASQSDPLSSCDVKRQVAESLASLKESTEGGVADATTGHHSIGSIGIERNVESLEEKVCTMQDEEEKVDQNEELASDSVDVKCDQVVKEGCESHSLLDHKGCVDAHVNINPEGPFLHKDVDDLGSLHDNLGSALNIDEKAEDLMESDELPPALAIDIRPLSTSDCSENPSGIVDGGHTIENSATGSHTLKTGALTDLDESNLFDVVVEVDPHVLMDEDDMSDDVSADSADSVVEFNVSDLVWSRVPSHPWWPGQICNPAASSKKAMKYFKTGRYLVAFFGDHTFSWKEAVMIKPFQEYFSELQKQSNLKSFHEAIDCALEEFSRRVEFSLACTCLSEELYSKIQTQTLTNAGIRKKFSKRVGGDSSLTASSFDPMKLINIVKEVALSPFDEADKLELVRAQAQLLAFNRWKGYYELPKFDKHIVVFNDTDHILDVKNDYESESMVDIAIDIKHDEAAISGKGNFKTQDSSGGKRRRNSEDLKDSSKTSTNYSNSTSKKPRRSWKKKHGSEENAGNELYLHSSSTKDEVVCNDTAINISITQVESGKTNQTFRVGDRIRKVAYQLNESNPILKHNDGISQKAVTKTRRGRKRKEVSELVSDEKTRNKSTKTRKRRNVSSPIEEASDSEFIKDTYWTDRLIQGIAEDQISLEIQNETVDCNVQTPSEKIIPTAVEQDGVLCPGLNSTNQAEPHEHVEPESETCVEDPYPTALVLTFTDLDSVPSETNLNDVFRKYGPLYESKTEVMKNSRRAKVVFKRTSDAEAAFSSTGKYSIFGTALVSFRLKFLPPTKVSSHPSRRGRKKRNPT